MLDIITRRHTIDFARTSLTESGIQSGERWGEFLKIICDARASVVQPVHCAAFHTWTLYEQDVELPTEKALSVGINDRINMLVLKKDKYFLRVVSPRYIQMPIRGIPESIPAREAHVLYVDFMRPTGWVSPICWREWNDGNWDRRVKVTLAVFEEKFVNFLQENGLTRH